MGEKVGSKPSGHRTREAKQSPFGHGATYFDVHQDYRVLTHSHFRDSVVDLLTFWFSNFGHGAKRLTYFTSGSLKEQLS